MEKIFKTDDKFQTICIGHRNIFTDKNMFCSKQNFAVFRASANVHEKVIYRLTAETKYRYLNRHIGSNKTGSLKNRINLS